MKEKKIEDGEISQNSSRKWSKRKELETTAKICPELYIDERTKVWSGPIYAGNQMYNNQSEKYQ